jgi:hypothetical protein
MLDCGRDQVGLGEAVVIDALARLRADGLTRHDAEHAEGRALSSQRRPRPTLGVVAIGPDGIADDVGRKSVAGIADEVVGIRLLCPQSP